ncbi:MAG TPA: TylF/MycF/NovP-related O-methyltransferase [Candidatus Angelobacter sp.]|nr:TylF/MycF/NovP-related O-methyltransferase [Candidatus Angelobacter sp.]
MKTAREGKPLSGRSANMDLLALTYFVTAGLAGNAKFVEALLQDAHSEQPPLLKKLWPQFSRHSVLEQFRATSILSYLEQAILRPGDIAECGVFEGGTSLFMAAVLREFGARKKLYMFDSFSGLPEPDRSHDTGYRAGSMRSNIESVNDLIRIHDLSDYCVVKEGWFAETFPQLSSVHEFCLVHVDCDLYSSTQECINTFYPPLQPGSPMIFDDYCDGSGGVQEAVNSFVEKSGEVVFIGPPPQVAILKGEKSQRDHAGCFTMEGIDGVVFSTENLVKQKVFRQFLVEVRSFLSRVSEDIQRVVDIADGNIDTRPDLTSPLFHTIARGVVSR